MGISQARRSIKSSIKSDITAVRNALDMQAVTDQRRLNYIHFRIYTLECN